MEFNINDFHYSSSVRIFSRSSSDTFFTDENMLFCVVFAIRFFVAFLSLILIEEIVENEIKIFFLLEIE